MVMRDTIGALLVADADHAGGGDYPGKVKEYEHHQTTE